MSAVLGYDTLMDVINQYTSLDAQAAYIEAAKTMERACPLIKVLPMVASNQIMSNIGSKQSYLPTPGTRRFNEYIQPTAVHTTPFTDPLCIIEDYSKVDKLLMNIQNDPNRWRAGRDLMKVEAMTQKAETMWWYGSLDSDPASINGFATKYKSTTTRPNGSADQPYNVVSEGGGGGDTTSVFVIKFGPGKVYGIYPKNMPAGLQIEDLGEMTDIMTVVADTTTAYMQVLMTHFIWAFGIVVEDDRCVQRYGNIEVTGTTNVFNPNELIKALNRIPGGTDNTYVFFSRSIYDALCIEAKDKLNVSYKPSEIWGNRLIPHFQGVPILMSEKIVETETAF